MNRKGFMMAELVVVSSVVIVTLVGLYSSYSKLYMEYIKRISYNDATTLYKLGYYRNTFKKNGSLASKINTLKTNNHLYLIELLNNSGERIFLVNNRSSFLNKNVFMDINVVNPVVNLTFLDYIDYFNNAVDYRKFNYVLIFEKCTSGKDNCSYSYLEVYEDKAEYLAIH